MNLLRRIERSGPHAESRSIRLRLLLLAAIAAITVSRAPVLVLDPRFWIDEGTVYFTYAWYHAFFPSLVFVSTGQACYLNLTLNLATTLAAHAFPIELAPWVTTLAAAATQMTLFAVVLFGSSQLWTGTRQRVVACAVFLFGPPLTHGEVWLNMTNAQVYFGLIAVVILLERTSDRSRRATLLYRALLVVCGLSGPYTAILVPAFVLRSRLDSSREAVRQLWIVAATLVVQLVVHVAARLAFPFTPDRLAAGEWSWRAVTILYHHVLHSLFGHDLTPLLGRSLGMVVEIAPGPDIVSSSWLIAAVGGALLVAALAAIRLPRPAARCQLLLLCSFACVLGAIAVLTVNPAVPRYTAVPGTILLLLVFMAAVDPTDRRRRVICSGVLTVALIAGAAVFWRDVPAEFSPLGSAPGRPSWGEEVAAWKLDSTRPLRIWPYTDRMSTELTLATSRRDSDPLPVLDFEPFSLVAKANAVSRRMPVAGLPHDFRIIFRMRSSQAPDDGRLSFVLRDADGAVIVDYTLFGYRQHQWRWYGVPSRWLAVDSNARYPGVRELEFRLGSRAAIPHQVEIAELRVLPFLEGGLEPMLGLHPTRLGARVSESPGASSRGTPDRRVVGKVAGSRHLCAASLLATSSVSAAAILLAVLACGVIRNRRAGWVVGMFFLAWPLARGAVEVAAVAPLAAALFLPGALWIAGWFERPGYDLQTALAGILLGTAVVELPVAAAVAGAIMVHLASGRWWHRLAVFSGGVLVGWAALSAGLAVVGGALPEPSAAGGSIAWLPAGAWRLISGADGGLVAFPFAILAVALYVLDTRHQQRDLLFAALLVLLAERMWRLGAGAQGVSLSHVYPLFLLLVPDWGRRRVLQLAVVALAVASLPFVNSVGRAPWLDGADHGTGSSPEPAVVASPTEDDAMSSSHDG